MRAYLEDFRDKMRDWAEYVRKEEALLVLVLLTGYTLCLGSLTGFDFWTVSGSYFGFFGQYFVHLFLITRLAFWLRRVWRPSSRIGEWTLQRMGGELRDTDDILDVDVELIRGVFWLILSLTIYSNIKTRIPFINSEVYDSEFNAIDHALFGEGFAPWLENLVAESPFWADLLQRVYLHDYKFMVLLIVLLMVRLDRFHLRWLFTSVCFVYVAGILITTLAPTMGPVFMEPDRYTWLEGTRIRGSQEYLKQFFDQSLQAVADGNDFQAKAFAGIAAFPSLHMAHMVILVVVSARTFPWYAVLMVAITGLTFVATVAFGWHYPVCAVGGAVLAVLVTEGVYRWMSPETSTES